MIGYWSPEDSGSGVLLWYDAADVETLTLETAARVSTWANKGSAASCNLVQGTDSSRPTYDAEKLGLVFASSSATVPGSTDFLARSGNYLNFTGYRVYVVASSVTSGTLFSATESDTAYAFLKESYYTVRKSSMGTADYNAAIWGPGERNLVVAKNTSAVLRSVAANEGTYDTDTTSVGALSSSGSLYVGVNRYPSTLFPAAPLIGVVHEILVVAEATAAVDHDKIVGYLAHKWGIAAKLPELHPYFSQAPLISKGNIEGDFSYLAEFIAAHPDIVFASIPAPETTVAGSVSATGTVTIDFPKLIVEVPSVMGNTLSHALPPAAANYSLSIFTQNEIVATAPALSASGTADVRYSFRLQETYRYSTGAVDDLITRIAENVALDVLSLSEAELLTAVFESMRLFDVILPIYPLFGHDSVTLIADPNASNNCFLQVAELLRQLDTLRGQSELAAGVLAGLGLDEGVAAVFGGSLTETAALLDGLNLELRRALLAQERLTASDALRGLSALSAALAEVATWGDRPGFVLVPTAPVTVSLSPAATFGVDRILRALETLTTGDRGVALVETAGRLADGLTALDRARFGLTSGLPDGLGLADVLGDAARVLLLAERMTLGEGAFGLLELLPTLREALSGRDMTSPVLGLLAADALELIGGALLEVYFGARAAEALAWAQDATAAREIGVLARELAVLAEGVGFRAQWGLAEGLLAQVLASPDAVAALLASDRLDLAETTRGLQELTRALAERWRALDATGAVLGVRAETLAILGETADPQVVRWLKAAQPLELAATVQAVSEVTARLTALGRLLDSAGLALGLSASGGLGLVDTLPPSLLRLATVRQSLGLSATSAVLVELAARLLEGMTAAETAALVQGLSASETATLADQLTRAIWAELTSAEGLALADAAERALTVVFRADDALDLADTGAGVLALLLRANDALAFIGKLPLEDGDYQAWVINTDTLGVTQYAQFPFDALVTHAGTTLGLTATGLYELTGDDDDGEPIAAWIRTGDLTLGGTRRSSVPRAYLYVRQDGDLILKTTVTDRGHRAEFWYRLTPSASDGTDAATRRVRLGRGVRGVSWAFEIANVDGADFDLRGCEVLPVVLSRRV